MKITKSILTLTTSGVILPGLLTLSTEAATLATENFDSYTPATGLNGSNGGTGFTSAWSAGGTTVVTTTGAGGSNAARGTGSSSASRALPATVTSVFSSNTGEIWLSLDFVATTGNAAFAGVNLYQGGTERVLLGKNSYGGAADDANWMISANGQLGVVSTSSFATIGTAVVRFNLAAGAGGSANLWIGTGVAPVDVLGAPNVTLTGLTLSGISAIAMRGDTTFSVDDIRFGENYVDVNAVPEPGTGLLAFGASLLLLRRRRPVSAR